MPASKFWKTPEEAPKTLDEFPHGIYYTHYSNAKNVLRIIDEGILSLALAERAKKPMERETISPKSTQGQYGRNKISLMFHRHPQSPLSILARMSLIDPRLNHLVHFIVDLKPLPIPLEAPLEVIVEHRIPPRKIKAIVLPVFAKGESLATKIIEKAKSKGIPVYGNKEAVRMWPPVKDEK